MRFLRRLFLFLSRASAVMAYYGMAGALRLLVLGRCGGRDALVSCLFRPLGRRIWFRQKSDAGVWLETAQGGYRIVDSGSSKPVRWIIDAGANIGDSTLRLRACHPEAKILAVEADADNHALLLKNCAGDAGLLPLHRALWYQSTTLRVRKTWAHVASRVSLTEGGEEVQAVTVPELMQEYGMQQLDILKLDIEGAESKVFQMQDLSWLQQVQCIIFEVCDQDDSGNTAALVSALERAGQRYDWHICGECLVLLRQGSDWVVIEDRWLDAKPHLMPHLRVKLSAEGQAMFR